LVSPSNKTGSTTTLTCRARPRLDWIRDEVGGTSVSRIRFFFGGALAHEAFADSNRGG
jgi:hypothetical protein